jgi:Fe-Mn family superoxide dismutase
MKYQEKKFNIGKLEGISEKTITEHLKLYAGYVKHTNLILEKAGDLLKNPDTQYAGAEMQRRFSFEFNGMRNHEIYFSLLESRDGDSVKEGKLYSEIAKNWGSFENWQENFKKVATATRGPGWVMLYKDTETGNLLNSWVDEQHLGILNGLDVIIALDMWEHSYYLDYAPADKSKYVEAFFANLNWAVAEKLFENAR